MSPNVTDPDFFSPGNYAHVEIKGQPGAYKATAVRGSHQGPLVLEHPCLRGIQVKLATLGWKGEDVRQKVTVPIEELPVITQPVISQEYQKTAALAIEGLEEKLCQAYCYQDPEDQQPIHDAFAAIATEGTKAYGRVDSIIGHLKISKLCTVFTPTDLCMMEHASVFCKDKVFEVAIADQLAPKVIEKLRLAAWHNGYSTLTWNEMAEVYNSLRTFTVGLPDFTVGLDYSSGCNSKGYTSYFTQETPEGERRVFIDSELAFFIYFKNEPVLVISFHVTKGRRDKKPRICIKQIQLLKKTGNRWLYKLPGHYMEFFLARMKQAFQHNPIHLIRGEVLTKEIRTAYADTLKRATTRLAENTFFSDNGKKETESEIELLKVKIANIDNEVGRRIARNYGAPSRLRLFKRRKVGNYWLLRFSMNAALPMAA